MGTAQCKLPVCAALFALLAFSAALAQDPTKVEPTHYRMAFENDNVQVVNVHYGPHEKSGLHSHPGGVVVVLSEGHLRFTDENGKSQEVRAKAGESRWFPPFKHAVENLGNAPYNAVYIGIKHHTPTTAGLGGSQKLDEATEKLVAEALVSAAQRPK